MDPFVGQLLLVPYNFAPKGWAFCAGQIMAISQNTALFSLLGTTYGGDGKSTFALPNLQGMIPIGSGQGPGLSLYDLGQTGGADSVTLLTTEIPAHTHIAESMGGRGTTTATSPIGNFLADGVADYAPANSPVNSSLNPQAVSVIGSSAPHNNLMPYLTLNWIIALQGVFPARS
jgi:microcystin-dependent protein